MSYAPDPVAARRSAELEAQYAAEIAAVAQVVAAGPDAVTYVMECLTWRDPAAALAFLAEWQEQH
jgi:hypothetical protein